MDFQVRQAFKIRFTGDDAWVSVRNVKRVELDRIIPAIFPITLHAIFNEIVPNEQTYASYRAFERNGW